MTQVNSGLASAPPRANNRSKALTVFTLLTLLCAIPVLVTWSLDVPPAFIQGFSISSHLDGSVSSGPSSSLREADPFDYWTSRSTHWWNNHSQDPNWRGRQKLHDELKDGVLWFDKRLEDYFISKLEASQYPSNCSDNFWVAHRTPDSGLLSCVHTFIPVLLLGLVKGDGYTVFPIAQTTIKSNLTTFLGCGDQNDKHVGCFFNVTSCTREDDPVRKEQIIHKSLGFRGASWDSLLKIQRTGGGGMTILRDYMYRNKGAQDPWRAPKMRLWKELLEHGSAGVHNRSKEELHNVRDGQVEFAMMSMVSGWMMEHTLDSVKKIADRIMAKYADSTGRPLWKPPVIAMHIRQTDKKMEDPYFREHGKYRSVKDYINLMKTMETKHGFEWPSVFIISDSGTAIDSFARNLNGVGVENEPDSMNGKDGKRFIMYDWSWDDKLLEKIGGHINIPPEMKYASQEHFLATLYIIHKLADYALVSYSSNVGRFVGELVGARHRLSMELAHGPNAYSWDTAISF